MGSQFEFAAAEKSSSAALSASFPPIVHDHLPKTLQKLCGESRTRRSSLQFYDVLSLRFWVLELPERHEILSPLQASQISEGSFSAPGKFSFAAFFEILQYLRTSENAMFRYVST